jgi:heavy metal translocating P-type ATPase
MKQQTTYLLLGLALLGLVAGLLASWLGPAGWAGPIWAAATLPVLGALLVQIWTSLRRGDVGLDVVAALSMSAALVFGEPLAGNVVALMYAGGQLLESYAQGRAQREMTALLGRVARTAMRFEGEHLVEVPIEAVAPGDHLLIRQGEVVPVDGSPLDGDAVLDVSALTGESNPARVAPGGEVMSGSTSLGPAFTLLATSLARDSTYAGIVRMVEAAQRSKPPMVRIADRYAIWFLVLTILMAGLAWGLSREPVRALAVLVAATPCPLILAVPVALISGISRAARIGVMVKDGGVFEAMARIKVVILDKTGTLTYGRAAVTEIKTMGGHNQAELLGLAASLEQASGHVVAEALVDAAQARGLPLAAPSRVKETPGTGLVGMVEGQRVLVGGPDWVLAQIPAPVTGTNLVAPDDAMSVAVAINDQLAGFIILADRVREDAAQVLGALRQQGVERIVLASGDRTGIAEAVGKRLGVDAVRGDLKPADKVAAVRAEHRAGSTMMVGDGVNDAPALAAADVGVAMGARGAAASSEAAGVVVLVDQLAPLADAIGIARRSRSIALQSVTVGLSLSVLAMTAAAFGFLAPVQGAVVQEAIDVAVILNAMRALR